MSASNSIIFYKHDANTHHGVIHHDILTRHCLLDNGRQALGLDYTTAPSLGQLSRLPVELLQQTVLQIDVATLLIWRRVNKRAMDLVSNIMEWKQASEQL